MKILPENLEKIEMIENLDLSGNPSLDLYDSFLKMSKLKNLRYLRLSSNSINVLPEEIGLLSQLEELYLDENKLTTLPNSIINLKNLKILYLISNKIDTLPQSFKHIKKGLSIFLHGNGWTIAKRNKFVKDFPNIMFFAHTID